MLFVKSPFSRQQKNTSFAYKAYTLFKQIHAGGLCGSSVVRFFKNLHFISAPGLLFQRVAPRGAGNLSKTFSFEYFTVGLHIFYVFHLKMHVVFMTTFLDQMALPLVPSAI